DDPIPCWSRGGQAHQLVSVHPDPARRVTTRRRHGGRAVDRHRADREDVGEAGVHPLRPVDGERHHEEIVAVAREDRRIKTLLDPWSTGSAAWPAPRPAPNLPTFAGA